MSTKRELKVEIKDGVLEISIGVETLAFAIQNSPTWRGGKITDDKKFAEDVLIELLDEDEEGTTAVHKLFDDMAENAINDGSTNFEEEVGV
jgi:hypothetical protein